MMNNNNINNQLATTLRAIHNLRAPDLRRKLLEVADALESVEAEFTRPRPQTRPAPAPKPLVEIEDQEVTLARQMAGRETTGVYQGKRDTSQCDVYPASDFPELPGILMARGFKRIVARKGTIRFHGKVADLPAEIAYRLR